jgi:hypothetical protein
LAGLLTGLLRPTTALLTALSGLLVLLTAALSALILISHIYRYSCHHSREPSTVAIVGLPTFSFTNCPTVFLHIRPLHLDFLD